MALNVCVKNVKITLKGIDKNEAQQFVKACAQASSYSISSQRLVFRLGYNISSHFVQARARK